MTYPQQPQPGQPQQPGYGYPQQPTQPYGQQPYPPQQGYPPPPPKRSKGKVIGFSVLGVVAFIVIISVIAAALGGGSDDGGSASDTSNSAPAAPSEDKPADKGAAEPKEDKPPGEEKPAANDEAKDLTSIELDDRSEYGIADIWVTYTVKNNSSKPSDYLIKYEVVDSSGTRADNGELYVTNLQPGQETKEEMFTTLETVKGMKLNVTSLDRTEAF
ncbi:hypothetical protein O7599_29320 [Streptomyces sp. WMMC500]|uniref:hypothetical protein n=1 Tax=Streptomyces sp. WMMC500 TaxID=3015154 RepID=UPI00248BBA9D|nr:hypothetical protein [Streptomyces sp. WMMC500]WBB59623.1 hypothetical protein O7599_29320 [Streptomyces sp. WMMC500]